MFLLIFLQSKKFNVCASAYKLFSLLPNNLQILKLCVVHVSVNWIRLQAKWLLIHLFCKGKRLGDHKLEVNLRTWFKPCNITENNLCIKTVAKSFFLHVINIDFVVVLLSVVHCHAKVFMLFCVQHNWEWKFLAFSR